MESLGVSGPRAVRFMQSSACVTEPWIKGTAGFVSRWGGRCEGRGSTVAPGLNCENPFLPRGQHKQNGLFYLTRMALVQSDQQMYLWVRVIYCLLEKIQGSQIRWPVSAAHVLGYENSAAVWGPNLPLPFCCYFYYSTMGRLGTQLQEMLWRRSSPEGEMGSL